jgi:transcription initiation factor IIF auxiliary subunit
MRRDRMKKFETDENKRSNLNLATVAEEEAEVEVKVSKARNIKEFKYMKQADGKVIKLDWSIRKRKQNDHVTSKLFTVNGVEKLIEVKASI